MKKENKSEATDMRQKTEGTLLDNEKKLQNSYHYIRSLIEASLEPLVTIDVNGKITDVNLATENAIGLLRDSLIITQTAYGFSGDKEKPIETGFNDYISKPINKTLLYELINKHCKK